MKNWLTYLGVTAATGPLAWTLLLRDRTATTISPSNQNSPTPCDCGCNGEGACEDSFNGCSCNGQCPGAKAGLCTGDCPGPENCQVCQQLTARHHKEDTFTPQARRHTEGKGRRSASSPRNPTRKKGTPARGTMADFYHDLREQYEVAQVVVSNKGRQAREVRLWGASSNQPLTQALSTDVQDHAQIAALGVGTPTFNHPQGGVFNPVDRLVYLTNQLADTVTIIDQHGTTVHTVALNTIGLGTHSPVAAEADPNTGKVYVASSVANAVTVIAPNHQKETDIAVGLRPVDLAYHTITQQLYVANYKDNTLSVIEPTTQTVVKTLPTGAQPRAIAIDPISGHVFVAGQGDDSITVFDKDYTLLMTLTGFSGAPTAIAYHPLTKALYVGSSQSDRLYTLDPSTLQITDTVAVGATIDAITFNPTNTYLYLASNADDRLTILDANNDLVATVDIPALDSTLIYHPDSDRFFAPSAVSSTVPVIGFSSGSSDLAISESYAQAARDFQYSPALIKHTKWVQHGDDPINVVRVRDFTPTGKVEQRMLNLNNHHSPQHFARVAEVFGSRGLVIDGKHEWRFWLAAGQTVTILLYYKQFNRVDLMPERSAPVLPIVPAVHSDPQVARHGPGPPNTG